MSPLQAFAGFDLSDNGQALEITNMPSQSSGRELAYTPPQAPGDKTTTIKKASRPENDPTAPALQVYNERYLPDSIRKKYGIKDSWYDEGAGRGAATASTAPAMPSASPRSMSEPLLVDDGPPKTDGGSPSQPSAAGSTKTATLKSGDGKSAGGYAATAGEPVAASAPTPIAFPESKPAPVAEASAFEDLAEPTLTAPAEALYPQIETWRARKGENVRDVVKRWSQRSGQDTAWTAANALKLDEEFSYVGSYDKAVEALMKFSGVKAQPATAEAAKPAATPAAAEKSAGSKPSESKQANMASGDAKPADKAVPVSKSAEKPHWFAPVGASLSEVLQLWTKDEGVKLVWDSGRAFSLKEPVAQAGKFEDAVMKALSQFDNDKPRPVGQLYADPATGRKVLLIRNDTTS